MKKNEVKVNKSDKSLSKSIPFAIIDIGSFSIRLVIYDSISVASRTLFNEKVISNLGKIVSKKKYIDKVSIKFLIDILERFFSILKSVEIEKPVILATAAIRNASNGNEFAKLVYKIFCVEIKILDEKEEGKLAALGTYYSHKNVNGLVGDLGGGSLEITEMYGLKEINFLKSLPIGHTFLQNLGDYNSQKVEDYINKNFKKVPRKKIDNLYAVGGAFRVIAKLNMYLMDNSLKIIQDYVIGSDDIKRNIKTNLFHKGELNEKLLSKVTKSRRNSISYALKVMEKLIIHFSIKKIYFSSSGIREGYILSKILNTRISDPFIFQIKRMSNSTMKRHMAEALFFWIKNAVDTSALKSDILRSACWVSNIAWDIHPEHRRLYAMDRILWYPFYGIDRSERIELALIMYFRHSNAIKDKQVSEFYDKLEKKIRMRCKFIGQCLRLAHHITGGISSKNLDLCSLKKKNGILKLLVKGKHSIFYGQSIPRGLKNAAESMGLKGSEIEFL
ncbi:hypothetical protein OA848_00405 [Rickettsiales bacterium]|nr:hypothetical protein [Rickettsiales bacterium]